MRMNSLKSPWNQSRSWSASQSGIIRTLKFTPKQRHDSKAQNPMSIDYTVDENDYRTPNVAPANMKHQYLGPEICKFVFI
ncbi:hypothetical protein DCAR_0934104 [Daucus carota subsp. sativus]|uniref:Uncharacterized protein n=1 Tax=Daucus carota subsp. sativus TaxID=79200 RepID=A0AAF1BCG2_DAUCS|nr:hypothetical protein DCAR_0934104 [Daucus carota subsp. sativus]